MGFNPRADWIHATSPIPRVTLHLEQLKEARVQACNAMIKAQQSWVKHRDIPKYKEGDLVWLEGKNLRVNQPTAKLAPRRHGPFKVIQVMSAVNYRLELPTQWSIHPVFHIDLLTPYWETTMHGPNFTRPTPELIDGEEEYSIEKILDSRHFGRRWRLQYLVKWEGYPDGDNMWVDKDDVFADDKVREFKSSNPDAATHIRSTFSAKSPYPPLLHDLNSLANTLSDICLPMPAQTSPMSTPQELSQIPPFLSCKIIQSTPLFLSSTSPPCSPLTPLPPPLFLDLSQPSPLPLTSLPCSGNSGSTLPHPSHQMASAPLSKLQKHLLFRSPLPKGKGIKQALAWNWEQLLDLRRLWELRQQRQIDNGLIPMARPPLMISDAVLSVENRTSTATVTPLSSQTPRSTSPLESQCGPPFSPTAWRELTSIVRKPQRWQVASSMPLKTTKMPLQFHQPTITGKKLHASSPKGLGLGMSQFPLALSQRMRRTRSCTSCKGMHVTLGINTRQTPSGSTGIRMMKTTAWQLDAWSSPDRRG
jgi:hypothetical protein